MGSRGPEDAPRTSYVVSATKTPPGVTTARQLVVSGYARIKNAFADAKLVGGISRGRLLSEMIYSEDWTVPHLLDHNEFDAFRALTALTLSEDILGLVWNVLENECQEKRLSPMIAMDRKTGHAVIRLGLLP